MGLSHPNAWSTTRTLVLDPESPGNVVDTARTQKQARVPRDSWSTPRALGPGPASPGTAGRPRVYSDPGPSLPVQLVDPAGSWMQARVDRESRSTLQAL